MKNCTKCKINKPYTEFYWEKKRQRYKTTCIQCEKEKARKKYQENPEIIKLKNKQWIENNKEKFKQYNKNNRHKYKEYDKQYYKVYIQNNREKIQQSQKEWRLNNPNYYKEKRKRENQKFKEYNNNYNKLKREKNISFRIKQCVASNINFNIKKHKNTKTNTTIKYLGCSIQEYIVYLENMFLEGMNWGNYGAIWEIDHIIPISSFDLTQDDNIFKAFNYKNTQPLFKTTEIAKNLGHINQIGNRNKLNKI
jgi:Fe2+ transport system protein B